METSILHDACEVCGARVPELRRNRCWGCYTRWAENRPVGIGASCTFCGERRRTQLKLVELLRTWVASCHNCAARATQLVPMPQSVDEIRDRLTRERRRSDRRAGKLDTRVFQRDRRGLERRDVGHAHEDDLMLAEDDGILIVEGNVEERGDETRILDPVPAAAGGERR
ncbi:MAG: hypothetical protein HY698_03020 [Deltaproteobacteria bacterium]|nr:hypothetical protein [Deltaproteobacteria bacterium]